MTHDITILRTWKYIHIWNKEYLSNNVSCPMTEDILSTNCERKLNLVTIVSCLAISSIVLKLYLCAVRRKISTNIQCDSRKGKVRTQYQLARSYRNTWSYLLLMWRSRCSRKQSGGVCQGREYEFPLHRPPMRPTTNYTSTWTWPTRLWARVIFIMYDIVVIALHTLDTR